MSNTRQTPVAHETLVFERRVLAAPGRVFSAYADSKVRARWSAPSPTAAVLYDCSEFRVGGVDHFRCGSADDLRFSGAVRYLDLITDERIVYCETISTADMRLAVSLVTWQLRAEGSGTSLVVIDQITSFVGQGMIDGSRTGMTGALDNLVALLDGD